MKLPIIDENSVEALNLPGRDLRWLVTPENVNAQHCSMCMIKVAPGETVRPAHSHPNGEEVVYIIQGGGRIMIEGVVEPLKSGQVVLIPQGKIHMLQNNGSEELKAVCFFAPAADLQSSYKFYEDIEFPA